MFRYTQSFEELIAKLSPIHVDWRDESADSVIRLLEQFPLKATYSHEDIVKLLELDFEAGITVCRLFLDLSKDEFVGLFREGMAGKGIGVKQHKADPRGFVAVLVQLGVLDAMTSTAGKPVRWTDILIERLKSGRGSAIKGQRRGKFLEDWTETIVQEVFGAGGYHVRCRFVGESRLSTEKADFAIPSKDNPSILIETKAYGATGSKLTDILGDVSRIVDEKRHDTVLLLVTDGVTWKARANDLRKLVDLQNRGRISRIYTQVMGPDFKQDLEVLKSERGL